MSSAPEELVVRRADSGDLDTLVQFNLDLARETESRELDRVLVRRGVEGGLARPESCRYFVAERAGAIAGQLMLTFEWSDWRAGFFWWIQSVFVPKEARGQGIFHALYDHVTTLAREDSEGCCGLRLYVEQDNQRAMKVYEDVGMLRTHYHIYEVDWT